MQFELIGGALCLDFVNTIHDYHGTDPREELRSVQDLIVFGREAGAISARDAADLSRLAAADPAVAGRALASAREGRLALYHIFSAVAGEKRPSSADLDFFNRRLAGIFGNLQIRKDGREWKWAWNEDRRDLDRVLWPVFRSAAELLTSNERERVRECESPTCTWLFVDRSKNHTRRWCEMKTCGNRAKWRRFYKKHGHKDSHDPRTADQSFPPSGPRSRHFK